MHKRIIIEAGCTKRYFWRDLWQFRELFFVLTWRDLAVRYKQTVLGVGWGFIKPLATLAVLTLIFGHIANLPSEGNVPYVLLVFSGMLAWNLMATLVAESANSLLMNSAIISKIFFPRFILPVSAGFVAVADLLIGLVILFGVMIFYGHAPTWRFCALPAFIVLAAAASLGPGLLLASLTVKYRDLRNLLPFLLQIGLYLSPVGFSSAIVPEKWRLLYSLNPVVGVIDGFRWAVIGRTDFYWPSFICSVSMATFFLIVGIWRFRETEKNFADLL